MQTIIDHLTERQNKPIEILHCLQSMKRNEVYFFDPPDIGYDYRAYLERATRIERIAEVALDEKFDLIKIDNCIFLGHWNSGMVKS